MNRARQNSWPPFAILKNESVNGFQVAAVEASAGTVRPELGKPRRSSVRLERLEQIPIADVHDIP